MYDQRNYQVFGTLISTLFTQASTMVLIKDFVLLSQVTLKGISCDKVIPEKWITSERKFIYGQNSNNALALFAVDLFIIIKVFTRSWTLFIECSLISAQALFCLRALFGAQRIHSYTRMAFLTRTCW